MSDERVCEGTSINSHLPVPATLVLLGIAGCSSESPTPREDAAASKPRVWPAIHSHEPNVPEFKPAFAEQTRAPERKTSGAFDVSEWKGNLFIASLLDMKLVRLELANDKVVGEEWLLRGRYQRVRDVKQAPDGSLYVLTEHEDGVLLQLKRENRK